MKTLQRTTRRNMLRNHIPLASAVSAALALAACGGGGGTSDTPPTPPAGPTTQELVEAYVQANDQLLAQRMPDSGAERYALLDGCYLGNGSTKAMLVASWSATQAQSSAHLVGRKMANVQVLTERKTTNTDGSARHEVDIGYDEKYTDGTTVIGQTETLVAGSTSGTCATPQTGEALRVLGNRRVAAVSLVSRNRLDVFRQLADGKPGTDSFQLRREVQFNISDPAKVATYAVVSWNAGDATRSLKLLSPRIVRDAVEMQGLSGNANWGDGDSFRQCPSGASGNAEANAATADCTTRGTSASAWGTNMSATQVNAGDFAGGDARFANWGLDKAGVEVRVDLYADDGWKTVNGQQGKTPVATYKVPLRNAPYPFAQLLSASYPMFSTIAPADESLIAAAFKTNGGTITATLQTATPPAGGLPMARSSVYSFRQGPRDAGSSGPTTVRTAAMGGTVAADGKTATIPYGGKPDGASATSYAEFGLIHTDRNGREMVYTLQYR